MPQTKSSRLKGVLPRDYARPSLDTATRDSANPICESHRQDFCGAKDHVRLGGFVDIISNIGFNESAAKSKDVLGRVYEYEKFASAEGTLQSAKEICGNRRMKRDFSLSASNGIPRPWERERMSAGQVRVEGENPINAETAGVRCRIRSLPVNNAR